MLKDAKVGDRIRELQTGTAQAIQAVQVDRATALLRDKETRIQWLDDLAHKQRRVIEARAVAYAKTTNRQRKPVDVPGGAEGLVVLVEDRNGVKRFEFDAALVREHRETLKQIAIEAGDYEKRTAGRFIDDEGKSRELPGAITLDVLREAFDRVRP